MKDALQQAQTLFPPLTLTPHRNHSQTTQGTPIFITHNPQTPPHTILEQTTQAIINGKTTAQKDKWGAQAVKISYLCQWQTASGPTQQCRTKEDLLHPDNILLDHNLLLIAQYHTKALKHKTTQAYATYLNHTQTKDNKFIHPPLKITNLTIFTLECNPNKDILTNNPTIQVLVLESHIYDQGGNYMATITTEKLHWLWNIYSHTQPPTLN